MASLLVKTLSKPVSKRIKHEFSRYKQTQRLLIFIGQTSHQITSRMTIWSAGYKVRKISALEDEAAMKTGADFVGESFILGVSMGTVLYEYNRNRKKSAADTEKKRAAAAQERRDLAAQLHALDIRLEALEKVVQQNQQSLLSFGGGSKYVPPPDEELVPITKVDLDTDQEEGNTEDEQQQSKSDDNANDDSWRDRTRRWLRKWTPW